MSVGYHIDAEARYLTSQLTSSYFITYVCGYVSSNHSITEHARNSNGKPFLGHLMMSRHFRLDLFVFKILFIY